MLWAHNLLKPSDIYRIKDIINMTIMQYSTRVQDYELLLNIYAIDVISLLELTTSRHDLVTFSGQIQDMVCDIVHNLWEVRSEIIY
jgi:hypothetical protein